MLEVNVILFSVETKLLFFYSLTLYIKIREMYLKKVTDEGYMEPKHLNYYYRYNLYVILN